MGISEVKTVGPWQIAVSASGVVCPDGIRRTVRFVGEADTFWTRRAKLTYRGKTVSGFVTAVDDIFDCGMQFIPTGKHADIFGQAAGEYSGVLCEWIESANISIVAGNRMISAVDHETGKTAPIMEYMTPLSSENMREMFFNKVYWTAYPATANRTRDLIQEVNA